MPQRECVNHTGTPAVGQCYACHKPICKACRAATPGDGVFCSMECYAQYVGYHKREQPVIKGSRLKSMAIGLCILLALAAAVIYIGGSLGLPVLKPLRDAILSSFR